MNTSDLLKLKRSEGQEMKLCINCTNHNAGFPDSHLHRCFRSDLPKSRVTGEITPNHCEDERGGNGGCGIQARFFEEKDPLDKPVAVGID